MEILQYTHNHLKFRQKVQAFVKKEITPYADQWEQDKVVPRSLWKRMGEEGLLCTTIAPEYGGQGHDFLYSVIVAEELSRSNNDGLGPVTHSDIVVPYIDSFACEQVKKKYLPGCIAGDLITAIAITESGAGSDAAAIETTAVEDGNEIIINGSKIFITNGLNCDLAVVSARDPSVKDTHKAISIYLVEATRPGFKKGKKLEKMGLNSQDTAELFFTDCRIPKQNLLGQKGKGFYLLMNKLQQERLVVSLFAVSFAEYILEQTIDFFKNNYGSGKPYPKAQSIQFTLVELSTLVKIGRTFLDMLIANHIEGNNVVVETSMAKYWTSDMVWKVVNECIEIYGDMGMYESCPIVKCMRDVRVMQIFAGTTEVMKSIIGKFMKL